MQGKRPLGTSALKEFSVNIDSTVEELAWSLYDFNTYAALGQNTLSFFQNPVGQSGKTLEDTNMDSAGQIPRGQNFLVEYIAVEFQPAGAIELAADANTYADDVKAVMESGWLDFTVGSKSYKKEGPLGLYPPQYRLAGFAAASAAATDVDTNYASVAGAIHAIIPVKLTSNQNFLVTLNWSTLAPLPSTAAGRIGVRLGGRLYRNAQ